MKKLCMLTAAALALMLLVGCSAQEETEPLPASMDQETVLAAGEEILNQLLDGEYEAVYGEFREDIRANLTVESVQELIESETQEAGTYEGIEKADTIGSTEGEEHGIARFLCNFSEEDVAINLAFDPDMELIGLSAGVRLELLQSDRQPERAVRGISRRRPGKSRAHQYSYTRKRSIFGR